MSRLSPFPYPASPHNVFHHAVVPLLGGGDKVDVNNANVRAYVKMPGMYPTIAGKIVSNGPYKSAGDVSSISGLTSEEKAIISKYSNRLTATDPQAIYTIDKFNNGEIPYPSHN
ncbi:unnamed protein product [Chrysoparadoxa australica]